MPRTSPVHYIAPSAVSITPNANGSASDLAVYVVRGCKIKVHSNGIDALKAWSDNNAFLEWALEGRNRRLADASKPYTIYARLSKTDRQSGYIVFAPKVLAGTVWKDKYPYVTNEGLAKGTAGTATGDYWYIRLGDVSLPSGDLRTVTLDTGILGTDQYNAEWSLNPDDLPLRVELTCTAGDEDAGPTPYVPWGKSLQLRAALVEGWDAGASGRVDHWTIERSTGDAAGDAAWPDAGRRAAFGTSGSIELRHPRNGSDDFNGAVSAIFTVTAWGTDTSGDSSSSGESSGSSSGESSSSGGGAVVALATGSVTIMAETAEKYELVLSDSIVSYNPLNGEYRPVAGIAVSIRAIDQRGSVFKVSQPQFAAARLSVQYAQVNSGSWIGLAFSDVGGVASGTIPISVFQTQQSMNVRLADGDGKELDVKAVTFLRGGEDTSLREWIFIRSKTPIAFGDLQSEHPLPSLVEYGEVEPEGAAGHVTSDKNQTGWVPEGWNDEAHGIDETWRYEYAAYRDYVKGGGSDSSTSGPQDAHWGDFSVPDTWDHWASDASKYRCMWTLDGSEAWQLTTDDTGVFQGRLPLAATLMKRTGGGAENPVTGETVITVNFEGVGDTYTETAAAPQFVIGESLHSQFIAHLNDLALTRLSVTFTTAEESFSFSIPVVHGTADEDVKDTVRDYGSELFLSKIADDIARGRISFLQGLIFDRILKSKDAIEGFSGGKGIWMDALQGLIQTDGLEVRGFMRIMELIINRMQLMESDYSFTEGAEVEHIDYLGNGLLKLWIHKEHDNDYLPFYYGDILYAKVNDLLPRGSAVPAGHTATKSGSYYTVWVVAEDLDYGENTVTVSLYASMQNGSPLVPGGHNFTFYGTDILSHHDSPEEALGAEMATAADVAAGNNVVIAVTGATLGEAGFDTHITLTRHGNRADGIDPATGQHSDSILRSQQARQRSWVLSTTDQRLSYFWRVDTPIIRDDNYALCLGVLPDLPNLPSTRNPDMPSLYINTLFYSHQHRVAWPASVVKADRGAWSASPSAEYTGNYSGTYIPDGTVSLPLGQDDPLKPYEQTVRAILDFAAGLAGETISPGDVIAEPYHNRTLPINTWLRYRLDHEHYAPPGSPGGLEPFSDRTLLLKMLTEWTEEVDLETSRAWNHGALWECLVDGTALEAMFNQGWTRISGGTISLAFFNTDGTPLMQLPVRDEALLNVTVVPKLIIGQDDISTIVTRWQWERESAFHDLDVAWAADVRAKVQQLTLTGSDFPPGWDSTPLSFKCTAWFGSGSEESEITNIITVF